MLGEQELSVGRAESSTGEAPGVGLQRLDQTLVNLAEL